MLLEKLIISFWADQIQQQSKCGQIWDMRGENMNKQNIYILAHFGYFAHSIPL